MTLDLYKDEMMEEKGEEAMAHWNETWQKHLAPEAGTAALTRENNKLRLDVNVTPSHIKVVWGEVPKRFVVYGIFSEADYATSLGKEPPMKVMKYSEVNQIFARYWDQIDRHNEYFQST